MEYKLYIDIVDLLDQLWSSHWIEMSDRRVPMPIFSFLPDASIINALEV